jgi:hypothetical protein
MTLTRRSRIRNTTERPVIVEVSPTVDTAVYAANDNIGGKLTLSNVVPVGGQAAILDQVVLRDASNQKPVLEILIFDANPTAATLTDNAAIVPSTDISKIVARLSVVAGDWATVGSMGFATLKNLGVYVKPAAGGTTLYAALMAVATPDFVAATDLRLEFTFYPIS